MIPCLLRLHSVMALVVLLEGCDQEKLPDCLKSKHVGDCLRNISKSSPSAIETDQAKNVMKLLGLEDYQD